MSGCRGFPGGCGGQQAGRSRDRAGGGQVPGPAAGPHSARTRGDGDARLRVCNARAPRPVCVSPRSRSFPPLLSLWQTGKRTTRTRQPEASRRGKIRGGSRGVVLGSPQGAPESERGWRRAGCEAAATPGGCRPRPPATQALPLFSPPPAPSRTPCREARPVCSSHRAGGLTKHPSRCVGTVHPVLLPATWTWGRGEASPWN